MSTRKVSHVWKLKAVLCFVNVVADNNAMSRLNLVVPDVFQLLVKTVLDVVFDKINPLAAFPDECEDELDNSDDNDDFGNDKPHDYKNYDNDDNFL